MVGLSAMLVSSQTASAQQQQLSPEEQQKRIYEAIDKEIEKLENTLKLEDWQVFMVDSVYTHDYFAMMEELQDLQKRKVENMDIYYTVQDKWMEGIYNAYHKILNEEQWEKYLKTGAARSKKARDKRAAAAEKANLKVKK